ncbi:MAG: hypothetical protein OEV78_01185 [Spirochaetia bacterium]|nr:hypothetical protein [Spirochaetia bacterium]
MEKFKVPLKLNNIFYVLIAIGVASLLVGFIVDSQRAWAGLLVTAYYILGVGLFGGFFTALHFVSGSKWSVVFRRVPESMLYLIIVAAVLVAIILIFGMHNLYEWTHEDIMNNDHILQRKSAYLNRPFFIIRAVVYLTSWFAVAYYMRKLSIKQDEGHNGPSRGVLAAISAAFLIIFAYFLEVASMDLIMSLEPHWQTTMFPMYCMAGIWFTGFAYVILITSAIKSNGGLKSMNEEHFHDLGKFQLAFTGYWGYVAFSQHMLTWYANLPEETVYLERRLHGVWASFTVFLWLTHFALPLLILLSSKLKRNYVMLSRVAAWNIFIGFVDVVWLVYGGIQENNIHGFPFKWMEFGLFLGAVGIIGYSVLNAYAKVNPEPVGDPFYQESVHFHQKH